MKKQDEHTRVRVYAYKAGIMCASSEQVKELINDVPFDANEQGI